VISAFADPERSPLGRSFFEPPAAAGTAGLYEHLLPRLGGIPGSLGDLRALWEEEDAALSESEAAIADGRIRIEEVPEIDLAVVRVPESFGRDPHSIAIHNATGRFRVLLLRSRRYEVRYRYETWIELVSSTPAPRIDLDPLAADLSAEETGGARWEFDGVEEITPSLRLVGAEESAIRPEAFRARIEGFLRDRLAAR